MPPKSHNGPFYNDGRENALHEYVFSQPSDQLRNNPAAVLNVINDFNISRKGMMIFHLHKLAVARKQIENMGTKPKVVVELGTYIGNSAIAWGAMLIDLHGENGLQGCKVYSMELESNHVRIARDFIKLAGLDDVVEIVQGPAADSLKTLHQEGKLSQIDMLFIDHWEKFYLSDLKVCEKLGLLKKGSLVIADNTDIPGAPDYVEYVKNGGSSVAGKIRYDSHTYDTTEKKGVPNVLEVSTVVEAP